MWRLEQMLKDKLSPKGLSVQITNSGACLCLGGEVGLGGLGEVGLGGMGRGGVGWVEWVWVVN